PAHLEDRALRIGHVGADLGRAHHEPVVPGGGPESAELDDLVGRDLELGDASKPKTNAEHAGTNDGERAQYQGHRASPPAHRACIMPGEGACTPLRDHAARPAASSAPAPAGRRRRNTVPAASLRWSTMS